jgi:hypothetical protein
MAGKRKMISYPDDAPKGKKFSFPWIHSLVELQPARVDPKAPKPLPQMNCLKCAAVPVNSFMLARLKSSHRKI